MNSMRIAKNAYELQYKWSEKNEMCWALQVKQLLLSYGFGHVWFAQGVGNFDMFLRVFKQRCNDIFIQDWSSNMENMSRIQFLCQIKENFKVEPYLFSVRPRKYCIWLTKLRLGALNIKCNTDRYKNIPYEERICSLCTMNKIEDEYHHCVECPKFDKIREKYLPEWFNNCSRECFLWSGLAQW